MYDFILPVNTAIKAKKPTVLVLKCYHLAMPRSKSRTHSLMKEDTLEPLTCFLVVLQPLSWRHSVAVSQPHQFSQVKYAAFNQYVKLHHFIFVYLWMLELLFFDSSEHSIMPHTRAIRPPIQSRGHASRKVNPWPKGRQESETLRQLSACGSLRWTLSCSQCACVWEWVNKRLCAS